MKKKIFLHLVDNFVFWEIDKDMKFTVDDFWLQASW